ncbi:MAG: hypothetical protein HY290_25490 [Planctomycetia bacterium]|nr:hypothetical protein [Planctomycetia bacterium]
MCLNLGVALVTLNGYATSFWVPSMFIRRYGWLPGEIGMVFGLIVGVAGVAPAAIQRMMPNTMRAQATAVYLFVINLIGMGLGPTVVAALTEDAFRDKQAVHYSLAIVGGVSQAAAGVLLLAGLKRYRQSLEYLKDWNDDIKTADPARGRG